jgi:sulfatase modifying factor 1
MGEKADQLESAQRGKIFISYRRDDSAYAAGRLYDRLRVRFGEDNLFMDVEGLDPGVDFVETLESAVSSCDLLIVLIGQQWLHVKDAEGRFRLDNPEDFVRLEIAAALDREIRVIPILVQGARMPRSGELPLPLKRLARLHALEIRHERFNADADHLVRAIEKYLKEAAQRREGDVAEQATRERVERENRIQEAAQQETHIADNLRAAQEALEREDWETACDHYRQVLRLQPEQVAAQSGLRTALERLELARLYSEALLEQDDGRLDQALHRYRQIRAREADYEDVADRICAVEALLAKQQQKAAVRGKTVKPGPFIQTLPQWMLLVGGGLGLIIVLALACWGGNALLGAIIGTEAPEPLATIVIAKLASATTQPPSVTKTRSPTAIQTPFSTHTSTPHPTLTPSYTPEGLPTLLKDDYGVPMALVNAGPFKMGGDADDALAECQKFRNDCERSWFEDEEPVHTVTLDAFYIDQYEVTNSRYAECVDAGICDPPSSLGSYTRKSYYEEAEFADYPVIYVSWGQAKAYCQWRDARLPTEAEREKAARGGLEGALYPWGGQFDGTRANFCDLNCSLDWRNEDYDDGYADTALVGSYTPNGYDLYDMAGNVWEWVADWYAVGYYRNSPTDNPTGPRNGDGRVLRGGSWVNYSDLLRVAHRRYSDPSISFYYLGFRCARSP